MRKLSLRVLLVVGIVVLMFGGLAVANGAGVFLIRSYLIGRVDQQLSLPFNSPSAPFPPGGTDALCSLGGSVQLPTSFVVVIFDQQGAERCRLPQGGPAAELDLTAYATGLAAAGADGHIETVGGGRGTTPWRVRTLVRGDAYLVLGISLADARATVGRLEGVVGQVSLVVLVLTALGGMLLVRLGLRPLTAIEGTAQAIAGGDLSRRVAAGPPGTEVGHLAASLNTMLNQIERAFQDRAESEERLRRFVADASHELRTPLATIRGHAELYRQGVATTPEDVQRLLSRIESESVRLGALVEDLLLLARLDAAAELDLRPVDLLSLAADAVVDARAQDPGRSIVLRHDSSGADAAPVVRADERRLRQVLVNLLSNALRHTPAGTPVEIGVGAAGAGHVEVRVVDHGPGLDEATASHVFERFYRGDAGRTRDSGGTGLGLSIVASLVAAHEGSVQVEPTAGGGSTFVVRLPVRGPQGSHPRDRAVPEPGVERLRTP